VKEIILRSAVLAVLPVIGGFIVAACPPSVGPVAPGPDADAVAPWLDAAPAVEAAPPVALDAAGATCQTACDAMAHAGCTVLSDCARVLCTTNADPRFRHVDLGCLTNAKTAAAVAVCGAKCTP